MPDKRVAIPVAIIVTGALLALLAGVLGLDPLSQRLDASLLPPGTTGHPLGTDHLGRDVLSRLVFGARSSYIVALGSAAIAAVGGTLLGVVAGVLHWKALDRVVRVLTDSVLALPTVLVAVTVGLVMGPGRSPVMWTLGVVFIPVVYRVARLETRRTVQTDYYRVSRMMGTGALRRVALHIVPAVLPQVVVQSASLAAIAIGTEAALSFLGLGTQPPAASWGLMLNDARRYLTIAPYLSIIPGIAAGLLTFALQYLSEVLARRIDAGVPVRNA